MDQVLGPENGPDSGARKWTRFWVHKMDPILAPQIGPASASRKWTPEVDQKLDPLLRPENGRNIGSIFPAAANTSVEDVARVMGPWGGPFSGPRSRSIFRHKILGRFLAQDLGPFPGPRSWSIFRPRILGRFLAQDLGPFFEPLGQVFADHPFETDATASVHSGRTCTVNLVVISDYV